jgi:hypothetical protein
MKAVNLYWLILVTGMSLTVISTVILGWWAQIVGTALTLTLCLLIVLKYKTYDDVDLRIGKALKAQLIRWFWYNLLIFPVLMAFYIPYNVFWLQYTPLQILKFIATNGFFGAIVNFVLRPWNAWIARFIERRSKKKILNTGSLPSLDGDVSK